METPKLTFYRFVRLSYIILLFLQVKATGNRDEGRLIPLLPASGFACSKALYYIGRL